MTIRIDGPSLNLLRSEKFKGISLGNTFHVQKEELKTFRQKNKIKKKTEKYIPYPGILLLLKSFLLRTLIRIIEEFPMSFVLGSVYNIEHEHQGR